MAAFVALVAPLASRTVGAVRASGDLAVVLLAGLAGYLLADLASGLVHWFCDTFFAEDTPVIGATLIGPFREHHRDPLAITRHGFFEVNGPNCVAMLPLLAWASLGAEPTDEDVAALARDVLLLSLAVGVLLTNQCHKWAHAPVVARPVRWAQRARLVLSPHHHARHHAAGVGAYCVTTGWLNPLLDGFGTFARLERALRALGDRRRVRGVSSRRGPGSALRARPLGRTGGENAPSGEHCGPA